MERILKHHFTGRNGCRAEKIAGAVCKETKSPRRVETALLSPVVSELSGGIGQMRS